MIARPFGVVALTLGAAGCGPAAARVEMKHLSPPADEFGTTPWQITGAGRPGYSVSADPLAPWNDRATWHLAGGTATRGAPAWMVRSVSASPFKGKRVRIDVTVRTQGEPGEYDLRAQATSRSWTWQMSHVHVAPVAAFRTVSLVLDVPEGAESIVFGPGTTSPGELWAAEASIVPVDDSVPPTLPPSAVIDGWHMLGSARGLYEATIDPSAKRSDTAPLHLHGDRRPFPTSVAGAFTLFPAAPFLGRRVRTTLWVRSSNASDARCVSRIESGTEWTQNEMLGGHGARIDPTSEWHSCVFELLVGPGSGNVFVGAKLEGTGDVWLDGPSVVPIDDAAPAAPPPGTALAP